MQSITKFAPWTIGPVSWLVAGTAQAQDSWGPNGPSTSIKSNNGHASVALGAFAGRNVLGQREVGGHVVVELPLGRLWGTQARRAARIAAEQQPPSVRLATKPGNPSRLVIAPSVARACVRAAWRAAGVADLDTFDQMRARARASALLPEARLRMARDWDQSYRLAPTTEDPYRIQESNGGGRSVEGRLTWKLDRLLFVDEELSMERLRLQRVQLRSRLAGEVLRTLFEWQRARHAAADSALDDAERVEAAIRETEAAISLDVLTAGWFSAWLAR